MAQVRGRNKQHEASAKKEEKEDERGKNQETQRDKGTEHIETQKLISGRGKAEEKVAKSEIVLHKEWATQKMSNTEAKGAQRIPTGK